MRQSNKENWLRALDVNDRQYGVANLAICDQDALVRYLQQHSHRLPEGMDLVFANVERYNRYDQRELMMRFYQCFPDYYVNHVVASGALEAPSGLGEGYYTTNEILDRLKGAPPPAGFAFAVGEPADGNWSRAIAMLREKIGLSPEGGYDMEAAEKLYLYGRNHWRTGRGYLYSDNDPDVLFDAGYKEYVTVVNSEVWVLMQLDINYLHDDEYEIWKVMEPGQLMYDQHGRTENMEPDHGKLVQTPLRILSASSNVMSQNRIDKARAGLDSSVGTDNFINDYQKAIWAAGAEAGYGLASTELTWYLLTHSLSTNPEPVVIEEGVSYLFDGFIEEIKNNPSFNQKVKEFLQSKENSFSQEKMELVSFYWKDSLDLFLAIHNCTPWIEGEKNQDGTWNLHFCIVDEYDFDYKDTKGMGIVDKISWKINNAAYFSQESGAITNFPVEFRFSIKNYEVE